MYTSNMEWEGNKENITLIKVKERKIRSTEKYHRA